MDSDYYNSVISWAQDGEPHSMLQLAKLYRMGAFGDYDYDGYIYWLEQFFENPIIKEICIELGERYSNTDNGSDEHSISHKGEELFNTLSEKYRDYFETYLNQNDDYFEADETGYEQNDEYYEIDEDELDIDLSSNVNETKTIKIDELINEEESNYNMDYLLYKFQLEEDIADAGIALGLLYSRSSDKEKLKAAYRYFSAALDASHWDYRTINEPSNGEKSVLSIFAELKQRIEHENQ